MDDDVMDEMNRKSPPDRRTNSQSENLWSKPSPQYPEECSVCKKPLQSESKTLAARRSGFGDNLLQTSVQ